MLRILSGLTTADVATDVVKLISAGTPSVRVERA